MEIGTQTLHTRGDRTNIPASDNDIGNLACIATKTDKTHDTTAVQMEQAANAETKWMLKQDGDANAGNATSCKWNQKQNSKAANQSCEEMHMQAAHGTSCMS